MQVATGPPSTPRPATESDLLAHHRAVLHVSFGLLQACFCLGDWHGEWAKTQAEASQNYHKAICGKMWQQTQGLP